MKLLPEAAAAAATFNAAADTFDAPENSFRERFGRRTVERLGLRPGERVLDVCCGSGSSAIPAARAVGPSGLVLGIDLAERMLERARGKAAGLGLRNVDFRRADMLDLPVEPAAFDAVICVFGIFFVSDMAAAVRSLWKAVRPGGHLAITSWGPRRFEPGVSAFWNAVEQLTPELCRAPNPWDCICDPTSLCALLRRGGVEEPRAVAESGTHAIASPEAWWSIVLGSGLRGTFEQLDPFLRRRVRAANLSYIRRSGTSAVEVNVVYAVARKPLPTSPADPLAALRLP
jgi:ubiquinone/menaquinone biosynthesis C-methylase UbiE